MPQRSETPPKGCNLSDDLGGVLGGVSEYPEEDSPDLADGEVFAALPTDNHSDIVQHLTSLTCGDCGEATTQVKSHKLLRRKPHMYWRVLLECAEGHPTTIVFESDWI